VIIKDKEIETMQMKTKNPVTENKELGKDLNQLRKTFNLSEIESINADKKLRLKIELLENEVKNQQAKTNNALKTIENERTELKIFKNKSMIGRSETSSQTNAHPDIPYLVTDPLPPIFSMELCHKSRPIHFLSRSIPNLNSILWCPPDDEVANSAEEFLAEQYDREFKEFYIEARQQACVKHVLIFLVC
jgi:hypothetical protein